ncbi:class II aldolase/adducin family protein [Pelagicoccus sp. SDUM812003]|uniref:class II aldolase/adducin family protein n=1 Tax=Pelagicoccus sp. SDUM812003 TaxID=3041267 RepID=UPI002810423E|nr:class II aldolase/adducin family protein [Pelagicoccus sp. SDUM812003]MDQ8205277.1 class II aldolase/adducin family protein [Pelagicoccus sp. SDUM812003]
MNFDFMHPRDQLLSIMNRIYQFGMTTTSGGNISLRESDGTIWITPAGVDKGSLTWDDIVRVLPDGTVDGRHRPSSEFPFHKAIYEARPDLKAIVHAHPPALVSYSIVRKLPPTRIVPQAYEVCQNIDFAPYALPGSAQLGQNIAETFARGNECVLLENHGVVCGGKDMLDAFWRFETLEFSAQLAIKAGRLGEVKELTQEQVDLRHQRKHLLPEFDPGERSSAEKAGRRNLCEIMHRAYDHQLVSSLEGVVSTRLDEESFLISPTLIDRQLLDPSEVVLIKNGQRERGKVPSRAVKLHEKVYREHPWINAIITAQPPSSAAFCLTDTPFATRTIPESYILLRDIPRLPFGAQYTNESAVSSAIDAKTPVLLIENEAVLVVGKSLLEAYDRLEVAEFSAGSLIDAYSLGGLVEMDDQAIDELKEKFLGE